MTDWLLDTLLATSGLILLVLLLREPVRRRFGAGVAYGLWLLPVARLLMPTMTTTVERTVPVVSTHAIAPDISLSGAYQPYSMTMAEPSLFDQAGGWEGIALYVWLAGAALMLLRGIAVYRGQRAAVLDDADQLATLGKIRIVRSHAVRGPLAFGVIDRVIALPADFDERFDARQRALALDHELAHHRAGDLVVNHLAYVLLCLQWFNPLAWAAHSAFRFDQEAACDARVLDRASASDRAVYGQAIAKAASGRALLFAGALDRPSTLQRRLKSMLTNPNRDRRIAGKAMIIAGIALALPLTATWATKYIDIQAPEAPQAPTAPDAPEAPTAPEAPQAPEAPKAPTLVSGVSMSDDGKGKVWMKGEEMELSQMTPQQRAELRRELAEARVELAKNRGEAQRDLAKARAELANVDQADIRRDVEDARREVAEAMREIDANAADIRKAGMDPEALKATVRASLASVEAIDVNKITREALASVDEKTIEVSLKAAEKSIAAMEAELDRLDRK